MIARLVRGISARELFFLAEGVVLGVALGVVLLQLRPEKARPFGVWNISGPAATVVALGEHGRAYYRVPSESVVTLYVPREIGSVHRVTVAGRDCSVPDGGFVFAVDDLEKRGGIMLVQDGVDMGGSGDAPPFFAEKLSPTGACGGPLPGGEQPTSPPSP